MYSSGAWPKAIPIVRPEKPPPEAVREHHRCRRAMVTMVNKVTGLNDCIGSK